MEIPGRQDHFVKSVLLPSGRRIEVIYFQDEPAGEQPQASAEPAASKTERALHVCQECDSKLVYPIDWDEAGENHWDVTLRCPNCEWVEAGRFEQQEVEGFDEQLDEGTEVLVRDYKRLMRANMAEEIDRFTAALQAGAILPEDF